MSLSLYNKKRKFSETPEPVGKEKSSKDFLRFVIQKHDATNLHYDFRLELKGVLKSWAVPKGPSLDPSVKRLAMMVEDHPYDYRTFEGIIPEGNYGGGTVIVWDEGTYEPMGGEGLSKKEQEKMLLKGLHSGDLKINMHGKKIKGTFVIFQLKKDEAGKSWLLVKKKDDHASEEDVLKKNKSVKSGKTLAQIAKANNVEVKHPEEEVKEKKSAAKKTKTATKKSAPKKAAKAASKKTSKKKVLDIKKKLADTSATRSPMPKGIKPMLATLVNEAFNDEDWLFEIKWDGYRALAFVGKEVELISRNNIPFTERYTPVAEALQSININAVFDGEIVAVDEKGFANFQLLQNWQNSPEAQLQFYIFDILWLDGYDVTSLPLIERKNLLKQILPADNDVIKFSDHVTEKGKEFFEIALAKGLEGIIAKSCDSTYTIGSRSNDWLKIKVNKRQEVVIAGFTEPRRSRKHFGALLLGVYDNKELIYVGHTGSGFNAKSLEAIWEKLQPLIIEECPFKNCPKGNMPVTWVKPELVCEIKFTEWTKEMIARHPIFMGLRDDKKPFDVHFEKDKTITSMTKKSAPAKSKSASKKVTTKKSAKSPTKKATAKKSATKKVPAKTNTSSSSKKGNQKNLSALQLNIEDGREQIITLNNHELKLTNLNKLYWKKEGVSKMDMINYYIEIAPFMLPYMIDRPQSLNRHPNGIEGANFYQKDMAGKVPDWMQLHDDFSESTNKTVQYLVCSNEATLVYMANLGCIEMHPWHSRTQSWQQPDWCLIDLDPDKGNSFDQVIETAQVVKKILDEIGATSFVKTSGSTGIHIYIPLGAKYNYTQSRQLAELIVNMVHQEIPKFTSIERNPAKRKGKIYLDYLQNRETQTAAAPYSLRPKPGAPVSTPLHWDEVKKGLTPVTYNIHNIFDRLKVEGDLFTGLLNKGIDMEKVLEKVSSLAS